MQAKLSEASLVCTAQSRAMIRYSNMTYRLAKFVYACANNRREAYMIVQAHNLERYFGQLQLIFVTCNRSATRTATIHMQLFLHHLTQGVTTFY